jgi:hypothetical protein
MLNVLILSKNGSGYEIAKWLSSQARTFTYPDQWIKDDKIHTLPNIDNVDKFDLVIATTPGFSEIQFPNAAVFNNNPIHGVLDSKNTADIFESFGIQPIGNLIPEYEIILTSWFDKNGIKAVYGSLVKERIGYKDIGYKHGIMGALVWNIEKKSLIVQKVLSPLEKFFVKYGYCGVFNVKLGKIKEELYFIENSCFFNETIVSYFSLLKSNPLDFIYHTAVSEATFIPQFKNGYNGQVKLVNFGLDKDMIKVEPNAMKHIWEGKGKTLCHVTSGGNSIKMVKDRIYFTINNIVNSPNVYYRTDIFNDIEYKIHDLRNLELI